MANEAVWTNADQLCNPNFANTLLLQYEVIITKSQGMQKCYHSFEKIYIFVNILYEDEDVHLEFLS